MSTEKIGPFPESSATEGVSIVSQTAIGAIPVIGGALVPIIAAAITAGIERRRTVWLNRVGDGLAQMEARFTGFDPKTLADNEDFLSAVIETTDAALKSSTESKRERLANVVFNIAAGRSISDALRGRFTALVRTFSDEHVLLLRLCEAPASFPRVVEKAKGMMAGSQMSVFEAELGNHGVSAALADVVVRDLQSEGMIHNGLTGMMSGSSLLNKTTTEVGSAFLSFIQSPL